MLHIEINNINLIKNIQKDVIFLIVHNIHKKNNIKIINKYTRKIKFKLKILNINYNLQLNNDKATINYIILDSNENININIINYKTNNYIILENIIFNNNLINLNKDIDYKLNNYNLDNFVYVFPILNINEINKYHNIITKKWNYIFVISSNNINNYDATNKILLIKNNNTDKLSLLSKITFYKYFYVINDISKIKLNVNNDNILKLCNNEILNFKYLEENNNLIFTNDNKFFNNKYAYIFKNKYNLLSDNNLIKKDDNLLKSNNHLIINNNNNNNVIKMINPKYLKDTANDVKSQNYLNNDEKINSKIIPFAIYFPQFHKFKENDINFYNDFTDINNLMLYLNENPTNPEKIEKPLSSFCDITKYNLTDINLTYKQVDLAKSYGIKGFAIYYYWFTINSITNKNLIMDQGYKNFFIKNFTDFKVFFVWANEDWSNNPAFNTTDKIYNVYNEESFNKNADNLITYFLHDNYYKIDNKPIFMLHHPWFIEDDKINLFNKILNDKCIKNNFAGVTLIINSMNKKYNNYNNYNFHPNYKVPPKDTTYILNNKIVLNYEKYIKDITIEKNTINSLFFDFNNTARLYKPNKLEKSTRIINNSNENINIYLNKLHNIYNSDNDNNNKINKILLINAWNEWGEKMHIEPSEEKKFYYLELIKKLVDNSVNNSNIIKLNDKINEKIDEDNFDWNKYLENNEDLIIAGINTKEKAWKHYFYTGKNEPHRHINISYKKNNVENYFLNFDWKSYKLNYKDLQKYNTKEELWQHWNNIGKLENRKILLNFRFDLKKYFIRCKEKNIRKNIKNNIYFNVNINDEKNILNENELILTNNYKKKHIFNKISLEEIKSLNSYIFVIDFPNGGGGTTIFLNMIISKYKKNNTFVIARNINNNFYLYLNDEFIINKSLNLNESIEFLHNNSKNFQKIFINHIIDHNETFLNKIFELNCEKIFITHDYFSICKNPQPFADDIIENNNKYLNKFNKIITQNECNLNIFSQYITNPKINIIISELPDYKKGININTTNNQKIIIGVIGIVSNIKGETLLNDICEYFHFNDNIEIVVFGRFNNKNKFNNISSYLYYNISELNSLLVKYKPNILLELSLWNETYSFSLTLAMATNLPILYIKKTGNFTIENRLSNYDKSYSFKDLTKLEDLIKKYKQDYFYEIDTNIYYNSFWNNLFTNTNN